MALSCKSIAIAVLGSALVSCTTADKESSGSHRQIAGDTTLVTIPSRYPVQIDTAEVEILLKDESLDSPNGIVRLGEHLVVGDRNNIHILGTEGNAKTTVGGSGEGPGEFRFIAGLGVSGDSIIVLDPGLQRLSFLDAAGKYLGSVPLVPSVPFVNPRLGGWHLYNYGDGLLRQVTENVLMSRPTRTAIIWHPLSADSSLIIDSWDDIKWTTAGRMIAPAEMFGPRALVAIGSQGQYAFGTGLDYCIVVKTIGKKPELHICREWQRQDVRPSVRAPDLGQIADRFGHESFQYKALELTLDHVTIGDQWPAFDKIEFDEIDRLWVRRLGREQTGSLPILWSYNAGLRPGHFAWDVFDTDGELTRTVVFPSEFDPKLLSDHQAFGTYEHRSGELSIAVASW